MVHAETVFELYAQFEYPLAAAQLILSMSGMGATLTKAQFQAIVRRPQPVVLVLALQYLVFPVLAAVVSHLASLPPGIALAWCS
jgi:BASS family bile acid:Na+ symporter